MNKIIITIGSLSTGGAERVVSVLSKPLADEFDEVQYVLWLDHKVSEVFYEIDPRVKIVRVTQECGSKKNIDHMKWFRNYAKKEKPNLVLAFMATIGSTVALSLVGTGVPVVIAERNDPRNFKHSKMLRSVIDVMYRTPIVNGVLMQTQNNKDYFTSKKIYDKTDVIYNPVFMEKSKVGKALITPKQDVVVSVGRLSGQKDQVSLMEAFTEFHKQHPTYKMIIYGEGELRKTLEDKISSLDMQGYILLPGKSNTVIDDIMSARMFVTTTLSEGMSNALIEAMCVGLPCVSTKVSGAVDLIQNNVNGYLTDIRNKQQTIDAMNKIADNNDLQKEIGKKASDIFNELNVEMISEQWIKYIYSKMK